MKNLSKCSWSIDLVSFFWSSWCHVTRVLTSFLKNSSKCSWSILYLHGKLFITRDRKNLSRVLLVSRDICIQLDKACHVTPGGPWKGFSCYQIPLINFYGMKFSCKLFSVYRIMYSISYKIVTFSYPLFCCPRLL